LQAIAGLRFHEPRSIPPAPVAVLAISEEHRAAKMQQYQQPKRKLSSPSFAQAHLLHIEGV